MYGERKLGGLFANTGSTDNQSYPHSWLAGGDGAGQESQPVGEVSHSQGLETSEDGGRWGREVWSLPCLVPRL